MKPRRTGNHRNAHPATLADVAARAKVSPMTVSRVVNGSARVSEATRARVRRAMDAVGYIPNSLARGLVVRRTGVLSVLVADITHPWYTQLAHAVEVAAESAGYTVVFGNTGDDPEKERTYLQKVASFQVDGVLIAPCGPQSADNLELLVRRSIPFVFVDREVRGMPVDSVRGESYRSSVWLTDHLIGHGHSHLAIVAGPSHVFTAAERVRAFRATLRSGSGRRSGQVVHTALTPEAGHQAGMRILSADRRPTAIVAANSYLAVGIVKAAHDLGLKVPEDVAIATFDDLESTAVAPFLTCYEQPARAIGEAGLRCLLERLDGDTSPPRHIVLDGEYRIRRSCGCDDSAR